MTDTNIIQNLIHSLGQSQAERLPAALKADYIKIDERETSEYLEALRQMAAEMPFFDTVPKSESEGETSAHSWQSFFPFADAQAENWLAGLEDDTPAHLGLLLAFLKLYKHAQGVLNESTRRHLNFYYEDVLRLQRRPATPDRAHIAVTLKKLSPPQLIAPTMPLSAGKVANGQERVYRPIRESIINLASVSSLRSLYMDDAGRLRYAPVANSVDGLGTLAKKGEILSWSGFGHSQLSLADVGFALSAPVLAMAEGERTVKLIIQLNNTGELQLATLDDAFSVFLTGEKAWLGPFSATPEVSSAGELSFSVVLDSSVPAVIAHDSKIHNTAYETSEPVMQILLNKNQPVPYKTFQALVLESIRIDVVVDDVVSLDLSNEFGKLNPARKFTPFGNQAKEGTQFTLQSKEVFTKQLTQLELVLPWADTPEQFNQHYANYGVVVNNSSFTADISFIDGTAWQPRKAYQPLFDSINGQAEKKISFSRDGRVNSVDFAGGALIYSLVQMKNSWSSVIMNQLYLTSPVKASALSLKAELKPGELICVLNRGFLHDSYRKKYVENVVNFAKSDATVLPALKEPVTPALKGIHINYAATSGEISMTDGSAESYANESIKFFQVAYFGHMREHKYIRQQLDFVESKSITLFNTFAAKGELIIGFSQLSAGDSVTLLAQLSEGSSDPDLVGESISWSVLCDNYWKTLDDTQLVQDSSHNLLTSGLLQFLIPAEATVSNSLLPTGYLWLKGSIQAGETAVSKVIDIIANAIEVEYQLPDVMEALDNVHLASVLPASSIFKFKGPVANVKGISQPYASFAGDIAETDPDFYTRSSETLRHKGRCVTPWDYERCVLAHFSNIHKVKCIPHAKPGSWLAPGNVLIVLIADLTNCNAVNPLQPRVDSQTLTQVYEKIVSRTGMQTSVHVSNPRYQEVQVSLEIHFKSGYEFNYYRSLLDRFIKQTLSPWIFAQTAAEIEFGGILYPSNLLKAIEDLEYVDFISHFELLTQLNGVMTSAQDGVVQASEPDVILVSVASHDIREFAQ